MLRLQLYAQLDAANGATGADNGTAAAGFHTNQKTVGSFTADDGGLISSFHGMALEKSVKK
jgi:hypothetical protein